MATRVQYASQTQKSGLMTYKFTLTGAGVKYLFATNDTDATTLSAQIAADLSDTVSVAVARVTGYMVTVLDGNPAYQA